MAGRRNNAQGWPQKRGQYTYRVMNDARLTKAAKAVLMWMAAASDNRCKPVWAAQTTMAARLACCVATIRNATREAEALGYLRAQHFAPTRDRHGRFHHRKANLYYLTMPPADTAALPAPRRRQRAPYCVIAAHNPRPHLPLTREPPTPYGVVEPPPPPEVSSPTGGPQGGKAWFAQTRADLATVMRR